MALYIKEIIAFFRMPFSEPIFTRLVLYINRSLSVRLCHLKKIVSEMTRRGSGGTLNLTQSLTSVASERGIHNLGPCDCDIDAYAFREVQRHFRRRKMRHRNTLATKINMSKMF